MRFLIDTHILLWFLSADKHLKIKKREVINNTDNKIYVSIISLWEIAIKLSIEKLKLDYDFAELPKLLQKHDIEITGISFLQTELVKNLPRHHGDPFDRMLIAQAISEDLTIITEDQNFKLYQAKVL
jgi:PIN domain nuclease of toxin-antitoxin system